MSILYGFFHGNFKKNSIPKYHKLSIPYQFYTIFFPWKRPKKLDTQMSRIKHPITFLSGFFHENVKKSSMPKYQELSIRCHFLFGFFSIKMSKKNSIPKCQKLSISYQFCMIFFMKMSKKGSIPKCHELSLRCHFHPNFSMEMSKKARYSNIKN